VLGAGLLACNELYYNGLIDPSTYVNCTFAVFDLASVPSSLTNIETSMQPAGTPSDFGPAGAAGTGPVLTLPIKVQLTGSILGKTCYVGSDSNPIVLHIGQTTAPSSSSSQPDPDGFPVTISGYGLGKLTASGFAEPGATGCGTGGALDPVINALLGLPSKPSENSFTATSAISTAWTTAGGSVLSQAYHAALG
jgi:hypothetical protein